MTYILYREGNLECYPSQADLGGCLCWGSAFPVRQATKRFTSSYPHKREIAQLIDLHQRSQKFARKGRERLPWHHRMLPSETRRAGWGGETHSHTGGEEVWEEQQGEHTFTRSPLCTPYSSQASTVRSRSLTKFSSHLIIILTSSLSQQRRRSH